MATLEERKAEYDNHKIAGYDYYNTIRSQLTLDVEAGEKTLECAIQIQCRLSGVSQHLLLGDWKSAYKEVDSILSNVYCTSDIIAQVKSDIIDYITNNYSW